LTTPIFYIGSRYNYANWTGLMVRKSNPSRGARSRKPSRLSQADYETLSEFRYQIRCFLELSQDAALTAGLAPRQHQALLAIKGFSVGCAVTIADLAERLRIRHHSAVELVDRLSEAGLVLRKPDTRDQRRVLLSLTDLADNCLAELSAVHLDELSRLEPILERILERIRTGSEQASE
jgi:DNA-binding MarR family transcriptional regulator